MAQRTFSAKASLVVVWLMTAASLLAAQSTPDLPDPGSTSVSREQQQQLGLQAAGEVYKQMPVLPDSNPVAQYVQQLGKKLETVIPQQYNWPYQFHVIPQKEINAFALPGGPIFVNIGTIQSADNEAELMGVLAHEMSHVYMQHSAKQMPKQGIAQIIAGLAGAVLPGSTAGNLARLGIQFGAGSILMKYSRADEAQADGVGAIIMYKAGYNPKAMADFFQKLEQEGGGGGPQFLSDHPNPGNREQAIQKEIQNWPPQSFKNDSPQFAQVKQQAGSVKAYTAQEIANGAKQGVWAQQNQQNGAVPSSVPASSGGSADNGQPATISNVSLSQVKPSGTFKQLQQQEFTISYPDNWQIINGNGGITIAPAGAATQESVAYGALINAAQDPSGSGNLDQATQTLVQQLIQGNSGMQASGKISSAQVNGKPVRSIMLTGPSPIQKNGKPLQEQDWLVTMSRSQGGIYYLVFVAPKNDFKSLQSTYQKMLNSFQTQ